MGIEELVGKTITKINTKDSEVVTILCADGTRYAMQHAQDCCENVELEDVVGDLDDILNSPVLEAYESSNSDDAPPDDRSYESYTWTFYSIRTKKGGVTLRWFGSSNGYYSERVDFSRCS